jgi:hypothetical protein
MLRCGRLERNPPNYSGKLVSGASALVNNRNSVKIIVTPSANVNPSGHTIAQTSGQSAHTPP